MKVKNAKMMLNEAPEDFTAAEKEEIQQIENQMDDDDKLFVFNGRQWKKEKPFIETALTKELDELKEVNTEAILDALEDGTTPDSFNNLIIWGPAGHGKTAIVQKWAKHAGVRLEKKDVKVLDIGDIAGAVAPDKETGMIARRLASTEFDNLDEFINENYAVLFLDELNRADPKVRGSILSLVNNHEIPDPRVPGGVRYLKAYLFTIVACNPTVDEEGKDTGYSDTTTPLDAAELTRYGHFWQRTDKVDWLEYEQEELDSKIYKALKRNNTDRASKLVKTKELLDKLVTHPSFDWDGSDIEKKATRYQKPFLCPRSLEALVKKFNGTKEDFLAKYKGICGPWSYDNVKMILANYKDADVKYNDVFKKDFKLPDVTTQRRRGRPPKNAQPQQSIDPLDDIDTTGSIFKDDEPTGNANVDKINDWLNKL